MTTLNESISSRLTGASGPAIAWKGDWLGWDWMAIVSAELKRLLSVAGVAADAPVALIARNRPQHLAVLAAQLAAARTTCMVYSAQSAAGVASDVVRLNAPVVVADKMDWDAGLRDAARALGAIGISISEDRHAPLALLEGLERLGPGPFHTTSREVALELLSSGTTGAPKRLPLTWRALQGVIDDGKAVYATPAGEADDRPPSIVIHPLGNVSGVNYVATALAYGQRIVLMEKFDVRAFAEAARRYRPQRVALPPSAMQMILDAGVPAADLDSVVSVGTGGGATDPALQARFEETYGVMVLQAFGATEFGGVIANWTADLHREFGVAKRGSAGRARPGISLRIVDPATGAEITPGEVGLLEARAPRIGPDWIRTTDLAEIDSDGFLFLRGRIDAAINRGGFKIVPDVVASVLKQHPAVAEASVIGLKDARLGEVPVAAVEIKPGATAPSSDDLLAFARERLLAYQIPVRIIVTPALPRNASMKVSIPEVKALFEAQI